MLRFDAFCDGIAPASADAPIDAAARADAEGTARGNPLDGKL